MELDVLCSLVGHKAKKPSSKKMKPISADAA